MPEVREPRPAPESGKRLGKYLLGGPLGAGGAASVHLAVEQEEGHAPRVVALKILHADLAESREVEAMFLDEANLAVKLVHPNIVTSYEVGYDGPHLFLVMEYLAGVPLSALVRRVKERRERLSPAVVAWVGASAARALEHAHALRDDEGRPLGVVHRDVSPENVFLTYDGRVLVIDWGIARTEARIAHTMTGRIKGKLAYMAPEQMLGQPVDHRADLFALGATLYEAALGARPFEADEEAERIAMLLEERPRAPEEIVPGFPNDFSRALLRALEREPEDRYPTASPMADALERAAALGSTDPRSEVTVLLAALFATERAAESRELSRLRGSQRPPRIAEMPPGATTTGDPLSRTIPPKRRRGARPFVFAALATGLSLGALGLALLQRSSPGKPAARPETVTLEVHVDPRVASTIVMDGRTTTGPTARTTAPRSTTPIAVDVTAPGFEPARLRIVPDHDRLVTVPLTPLRAEPLPRPAEPE